MKIYFKRILIMNILELRKIVLAVLLAFAAVRMLPACSSTEEAPPPEEGGGSGGSCEEQCGGDPNCIETCIQNLPI